jgi:hypothetical protein
MPGTLRRSLDQSFRVESRYLHDPGTGKNPSRVLGVFRTSEARIPFVLPSHRIVGAVWIGVILGALLVFVVNVSVSIYAMAH